MTPKDKNNRSQICSGTDSCQTHSFNIKSLTPNLNKIQPALLNCCPLKAGTYNTGNIYPQWNADGNHFTSCFVLGVDKHYNEQNRSFEFDSFLKRVERACQLSSELCFPQPVKKAQYCSICLANYDDYLTHINSQMHSQNSKLPRANQYIEDLCGLYPQTLISKKKLFFEPKTMKRQKRLKGSEKIQYQGSTLASKKQNKNQGIEGSIKCNVQKRKGIKKMSLRKMSLRSYKGN